MLFVLFVSFVTMCVCMSCKSERQRVPNARSYNNTHTHIDKYV